MDKTKYSYYVKKIVRNTYTQSCRTTFYNVQKWCLTVMIAEFTRVANLSRTTYPKCYSVHLDTTKKKNNINFNNRNSTRARPCKTNPLNSNSFTQKEFVSDLKAKNNKDRIKIPKHRHAIGNRTGTIIVPDTPTCLEKVTLYCREEKLKIKS